MEENSENNFNYNYEVDINYAAQNEILENLMNKYNINPKKTKSVTNSASSSQQSSSTYSNSLSQTNSSSSNSSNSKQNTRKIPNAKTEDNSVKTNKNKSYENVVTVIDAELLKNYGQQILNELEILEINCEVKNHICSNLVTWTYLDIQPQTENNKEFETVLLILGWSEVVNYISTNSFLQHIKSISDILLGKRIILGLYGFENYFKYWKSQKQSGKPGKASDKKFSEYKASIKINRYELEYVLTELEIRYSCCHRFLENIHDLVNMIGQFTKSISQLPEKLEKAEKYKNVDFCVMKDNRDCVLVDKNGNGYRRLWQQQLTTFEWVGLEKAEAILSKYATPSELFDAYEQCNSQSEGVKLLEDIPIRRAVGPLTTTRRIGQELSSKMYNFFKAVDGNTVV